jgi:hypothetical protein
MLEETLVAGLNVAWDICITQRWQTAITSRQPIGALLRDRASAPALASARHSNLNGPTNTKCHSGARQYRINGVCRWKRRQIDMPAQSGQQDGADMKLQNKFA